MTTQAQTLTHAPLPSSETLRLSQRDSASAEQLLHVEAMKYDSQQNLISGSSLWQSKVSAVFIYFVICPAIVLAL